MAKQEAVVSAIKELEGDLGRFGTGSSAIVYPDSPKLSESVRSVYEAIQKEGVLNYSLGACDLMYVEGTDNRIETKRLTKEVMITTLAGKLVVPSSVRLYPTSRR